MLRDAPRLTYRIEHGEKARDLVLRPSYKLPEFRILNIILSGWACESVAGAVKLQSNSCTQSFQV